MFEGLSGPRFSAPRIALVAATAVAASGCGMCGNADAKEYVSPDRAMNVVVFTRDCGATTDFSTQVSVLPLSASLPNASGNAFVEDGNGRVSGTGGTDLGVRWLDARTVELSHHADARVFKAETSVNSIKIVYRTWR